MSSAIDVSSSDSPLPVTAWQLFIALSCGKLKPGKIWENPAYRRRFLLRSIAMPFSTLHYLTRLVRAPFYAQMLRVQPGLPCRLHRPWLSTIMTRQQTAEAICWHYDSMIRLLTPKLAAGYLSESGILLAILTGKDEETFSLRLCADCGLDREGEATLTIADSQNNILAKLTFALCPHAFTHTLYIGGLQGPKPNVPHALIQHATKACHGLFPKRLLAESVVALASFLGIDEIRAVSNDTHIYRSLRYRKKKKDKLLADYSGFWQSLGAHLCNEGDYILPPAIPRKPLGEIASKKRAEYRRRFELLDCLNTQISEHFQN